MAIIICHKCGEKVPPNANFCPQCGTPVTSNSIFSQEEINDTTGQQGGQKIITMWECPDCGLTMTEAKDCCPNCACPNSLFVAKQVEEIPATVTRINKPKTEKKPSKELVICLIFLVIVVMLGFLIANLPSRQNSHETPAVVQEEQYEDAHPNNNTQTTQSVQTGSTQDFRFHSAYDVGLYLIGKKFYHNNGIPMSFTSSMEMTLNGKVFTGAMRIRSFNATRAYLVGNIPYDGSEASIMIDASKGTITDLSGSGDVYRLRR